MNASQEVFCIGQQYYVEFSIGYNTCEVFGIVQISVISSLQCCAKSTSKIPKTCHNATPVSLNARKLAGFQKAYFGHCSARDSEY